MFFTLHIFLFHLTLVKLFYYYLHIYPEASCKTEKNLLNQKIAKNEKNLAILVFFNHLTCPMVIVKIRGYVFKNDRSFMITNLIAVC